MRYLLASRAYDETRALPSLSATRRPTPSHVPLRQQTLRTSLDRSPCHRPPVRLTVFGMKRSRDFIHRLATMDDLPELRSLMTLAIRDRIGAYLDEARVEASFEIMGVDTQLIEDGTYFVVECVGRIAGCGGWSGRATLFGGDHSAGRDARRLDPSYEPARVRAMYTHPEFMRRGVGKLVLSLCEAAAAREGFRSLELVATVAGEPLYTACGYAVIERMDVPTSRGVTVPCARMSKAVGATP